MANNNKKRHFVQLLSSIAVNGNFKGFLNGQIYTGKTKKICVPILNCYSCPGALGACPIGSLQAVIGSMKYNISYYVLGFMSLIGVMFGRFVCGWLCPFGFIQDLLYKIPAKFKLTVSKKANNILKYLKYAVFAIFVLILPLTLQDEFGMSDPYFCKYICPAGTLEAGIPLTLLNKGLRSAIGFLFSWKVLLLIIIVVLSISVYRVFCRYICPLGAFYSLFNSISFYKIKVDKDKCINCNACTNNCKMNIEVYKKPNSAECIRCGDCIKSCPTGAIKSGIFIDNERFKTKKVNSYNTKISKTSNS